MFHFLRVFFVVTYVALLCAAGSVVAQSPEGAQAVPTQALIDALEDPEARARIIEALQANASDAGADDAEAEEESVPQTLAAVAADVSRQAISDISAGATRVYGDLSRFALLPDLLTPERRQNVRDNFVPLLITVLLTVSIYRLARTVTGRIRLNDPDEDGLPFLKRVGAFFVQVTLRMMSVLLAWVIGYAFASFGLSDGEPRLSQALYLNAFIIFGVISITLSVFVSEDPRDMSFSRMSPKTERIIYQSVRRVFGFLIYGLVAVAPIAQVWVNFVLARSMRTLVVTLGVLAAFYAIWRIRRALNREFAEPVEPEAAEAADTIEEETKVTRKGGRWLSVWPWLAGFYVFVSYGLALLNPNTMVETVGRATLLTATSLGVFLVAMRFFENAGGEIKVTLPTAIKEMFPPLEEKLAGFAPAGLVVAGVALIVVSAALFLEAWLFADVFSWLAAGGSSLVWRAVFLMLGVVVLIVGWSVLTSWIDTRLSEDLSGKQVSSRSRTLLALFKNIVSIALVIFGGMTVLSELGVDIAPLLAGAGVLGLAIGFGSQKLVQDIITGVFIQLENAINEGDVVTVGGITGVVEKLTIRSVALRDLHGAYHLIPFSSVDTVANFMRKFAFHVEVVGISYDSDVDVAKEAMHRAFDTLKEGQFGREIIAPLEWHGVVSLGDSSVNLRARIRTRPGQQWAIGRAYTEQVKRELDASHVQIPFPHRELKMPAPLLEQLSKSAPKTNRRRAKS